MREDVYRCVIYIMYYVYVFMLQFVARVVSDMDEWWTCRNNNSEITY